MNLTIVSLVNRDIILEVIIQMRVIMVELILLNTILQRVMMYFNVRFDLFV